MEDLDSLLEDLGRGKLSSTNNSAAKKPAPVNRPISSRVDLNELEDLMEDLAAPTAKPTPTPVAPVATTSRVVESTPAAEPPKKAPEPKATPAPRDSAPPSGGLDDLEALMESLNMVSNKRVTRREPLSSAPASAPAAAAEPAPAYVPPKDPTPARASATTHSAPAAAPASPAPAAAPRESMASVKGDDLDNLLKGLQQDLSTVDKENPAAKGTCWTCRGPILGEIIQALGRAYHPEHFTCSNCRDPLGTRNFYEQGGQPICQNCHGQLFCPKCAHCDQAITDRCITAMGKKFHPEHFICAQCLKPFGNGSFFERDGRAYCETDFFNLYAPKCGACQEPIKGDCINALGQQWHPEHFVCTYCSKAFSGVFFEHGGKPYCEAHYHQQSGSLCGGCGKAIAGRCVNALDKKWHPEHFVCAFCMNPLAGGTFSEKNNKAYCKECHTKLFGN